jgi:hypothetical protein
MDTYHVALFLHVTALVIAAGAAAIIKLALRRRARARTVAEMLDWHLVLMKTSLAFPICLAVLLLTGGYMLSVSHLAPGTGFVVGGVIGIVVLLLAGTVLGAKGKALKRVLEPLAANGPDQPAPPLDEPRYLTLLPYANSGLVLGVVLDMVAKPPSITTALTMVFAGMAIGVAFGRSMEPVTVTTAAPEGG